MSNNQASMGVTGTLRPPECRSSEVSVLCRGITVRYHRTVAVDGVTFDVRQGEVLGLLGPNGAGKTSLIRALTTMLPLAGGEATIAGIDRRYPDIVRSRIGVLPESSGYPGDQSAIDYIRYHGLLYGIPHKVAHDRGLHLLGQLGLGERAKSRIRTFSRGMKQRLGIARALINEPDVLFLDEPTLGLDPAGQDEVLRHVRTAATDGGVTVIVTSHLLDEINRVCDRVVIMNKGRVVSTGSVDEVVVQAGLTRPILARLALYDVDRAISRLRQTPEIVSVEPVGSRPREIRVETRDGGATGVNVVAAALVSADIPVMSLQLEGATLNDAFLRLTGGTERLTGGTEEDRDDQ